MARSGSSRSSRSSGFSGFPPEALDFYARLELDNSKAFWEANRHIYDRSVREPMEALCASFDERFLPLRVFRPQRDVRFSKDKTPYKDRAAAVGERQGGAHYYVQLSAHGLYAASGYHHLAADQLARLRAAIDGPNGGKLEEAIGRVRKAGCEVGGDSLKTAPRGWPKDHPRIELLRLKGLTAGRDLGAGKWLHRAEAAWRVEQVWTTADPLNDWLDAHVGPSELPPDDMR